MKVFLAPLAVAALASAVPLAAQAQSSVTVFGTIDVGVTHIRGENGSRTGLSHSNANISRFGFRGVEDLGGGLKAGFWLETALLPDEGNIGAGFNRRATVSLMGNWGEVRLGRDDSVTFLNALAFGPVTTNGVGGVRIHAMNGAPTIQISNAISYFLPPNLGGFYGQIQHAPGERLNTDPTAAGEYNGARFGYREGPWHVSVAAAKLQGLTQAQDQRFRNAGLSYDFGVAHPMLLWASHKRGDVEVRGLQLGVKVPVGAGEIRASVGRYDAQGSNADWRKAYIGYGHNLSKRTQLYVGYAHISNKDGSARTIDVNGLQPLPAQAQDFGGSSSGYEMGVRHYF